MQVVKEAFQNNGISLQRWLAFAWTDAELSGLGIQQVGVRKLLLAKKEEAEAGKRKQAKKKGSGPAQSDRASCGGSRKLMNANARCVQQCHSAALGPPLVGACKQSCIRARGFVSACACAYPQL